MKPGSGYHLLGIVNTIPKFFLGQIDNSLRTCLLRGNRQNPCGQAAAGTVERPADRMHGRDSGPDVLSPAPPNRRANLHTAIFIHKDTVQLGRTIREHKRAGLEIPENLLSTSRQSDGNTSSSQASTGGPECRTQTLGVRFHPLTESTRRSGRTRPSQGRHGPCSGASVRREPRVPPGKRAARRGRPDGQTWETLGLSDSSDRSRMEAC